MAFIRMKTKQHQQGAKFEDFIFKKLKQKGFSLYRQDSSFSLPKTIKELLPNDLIDILENYPIDFFMVKNNQLFVVEVKSKKVTFTKDDRKLDISHEQYDFLSFLEEKGIKVKILVVWFQGDKFYYKFFDFSKLKIIGNKKLKLKLPKELKYSPEMVKYEKIDTNLF